MKGTSKKGSDNDIAIQCTIEYKTRDKEPEEREGAEGYLYRPQEEGPWPSSGSVPRAETLRMFLRHSLMHPTSLGHN